MKSEDSSRPKRDIERAPSPAWITAAATSEFDPLFIVGDRQGEPYGDDKFVLSLLRACRTPVLLLR